MEEEKGEEDRDNTDAEDLYEALQLLSEYVDLFDEIVTMETLNLPPALELNLYKLDKRVTTFIGQWEN